MKRFYLIVVAAVMMAATACVSEFDDTKIWNEFDSVYDRIEKLEEMCRDMNNDISSLELIVNALQNNDYITSVTPINQGNKVIGYSITFAKSGTIIIYNGEDGKDGADGKDGKDGENGKDGKDGYSPVIGVRKHSDGLYYWTLDGDWLRDNDGNMIPATATGSGSSGADGSDGKDGKDGKDGVTPQLKIENEYWYVSYDNGKSWTMLGKATGDDGEDGNNGKDGKDGDSFFKAVRQDDKNVYFDLADGTTITVPLATSNPLYRLQSISYVPLYSDGKALVEFTTPQDSFVIMDFELAPKDVASEIAQKWNTILSMKAVNVTTRATSFVEMAILSCTADAANGIITVKASGKNLSESFFNGEQHMSARIELADDNFNHKSEYVPIITINHISDTPSTPVAPSKPQPKDNEIIYTSQYEEVIEPYKNASFGANIVSNIYADGYGVITFDAAITEIGSNAFNDCDTLIEVFLPDGLLEIGSSAFSDCDRLESIDLGEGVTYIGWYAFEDCPKMKSVTIPDSVTEIGNYAFRNCVKIETLTVGNGVKTIGASAFTNCKELTTVSLGNKLTEIGGSAFTDCVYLATINFPEKLEVIGGNAFSACNSLTTITLPDSLTEIGNSAFSDCANLTNVDFGEGVTYIGWYAFEDCPKMKSVTIPDSVTEIGNYAFRNCVKIETLTVGNGVKTIGASAFTNCKELTTVSLGNKLTEIGGSAFTDCVYLATINFPEKLEVIGGNAFSACNSLTTITLPDSLTEIGNSAFSDCANLTNVDFGEGVTYIGWYAFEDCPKMKSVTIPDSVTEIGNYAFRNCSTLATVYCKPTTPPTLGSWAFDGNAENRMIYVPASVVDTYKTKWTSYADYITAGNF